MYNTSQVNQIRSMLVMPHFCVEKQILREALNAEESQFIAVYGRRHVGKTHLIRQTYGDSFTFEHSGLANGNRKEQIQAFTASIRRAGLNSKKAIITGSDYNKSIQSIQRDCVSQNKTIQITGFDS